jgi:hypothetical protein
LERNGDVRQTPWAKVDKTVLSKRVSPPPSKEEVYMYYVMVITWYFFIENKKKDKSSMTKDNSNIFIQFCYL